MKHITYALIALVATTLVPSVTADAIVGTTPKQKEYCIRIGTDKSYKMGVVVGCGYTYNECTSRLPSKLAAYKKEFPRYKNTAVARCEVM